MTQTHRLSAARVRNAPIQTHEYKLTDGNGMYLRVRPPSSKSWYYQYRLGGTRQRPYCLGSYPEVGLQKARELLVEARKAVARGCHPLQERTTKQVNTFEHVARQWIDQNQQANRWSASYRAQVLRNLEANAFPQIGTKPISELTARDLLQVIQGVADRRVPPGKKKQRARGASTVATQLRALCSQVMRYAIPRGLAERDVASDLKGAVVRPRVRNNPGLEAVELPQLIAHINAYREGSHTKLATLIALELLALTFVRTGELRLARWDEFDFDRQLWTIPAERMKACRAHLVPLSPRALELLIELRQLNESPHWLFPNSRDRDRPMSATTINRVLERMKYSGRLSAHGLRSTASTLLHERGFRHDVIEKQLAHETGNRVASAYNKAEYLDDRRAMMAAWADVLLGRAPDGQNVTPLRNAA